MIPLAIISLVGLALAGVHIFGWRQDYRRERRRQQALDSMRWPE